MIDIQTPIWFPEPDKVDDTYAARMEQTFDWLARSTVSRAQDCRRFLNENLNILPRDVRVDFYKALQTRWHSAFFELIIARFLLELGATIDVEPVKTDGSRPDFKAKFRDEEVLVEATAPVFNSDAGTKVRRHAPLLNIIEAHCPEGGYVGVWELPDIGPQDSTREFKQAIQSMLALSPPESTSDKLDLIRDLSVGTVHLHLVASTKKGKHRLAFEAPITSWDNSEARIRYVIKSKRRQVRNTGLPVLLAIHASGISSDFEDFDKALFGYTLGWGNLEHEVEATGFDPNGMFTYNLDKPEPPTFAGVLAFVEVGFQHTTQPVLYLHPRFSGSLPGALMQLEQRSYDSADRTIQIKPAQATGLLQGLNFVER